MMVVVKHRPSVGDGGGALIGVVVVLLTVVMEGWLWCLWGWK